MWIDLDIAPGEKHDLKSEFRRRATLNEAGKTWIAELALPMKSLVERFDPVATWRVNFLPRGRTEGTAVLFRMAADWNASAEFHVPEAFGKLIFADSAAANSKKCGAVLATMGAGFGDLFFLCFPVKRPFCPFVFECFCCAHLCCILSAACRKRPRGNRGPAAETQ